MGHREKTRAGHEPAANLIERQFTHPAHEVAVLSQSRPSVSVALLPKTWLLMLSAAVANDNGIVVSVSSVEMKMMRTKRMKMKAPLKLMVVLRILYLRIS